MISLVSLVGGVGVTSLAGNLALAMRYTLDKRVAVIDLDLQASALSVFLNVEPDRTMMALTEGEKKIDSIQLEARSASTPRASTCSRRPSGSKTARWSPMPPLAT